MQEQITELNLTKAKPMRLFSQAIDQIRNLIFKGTLKPGDKLPSEQSLSQQLGVSRPSLREALRALESEGLIEVRAGTGAYVAENALMMSSLNAAIKRLAQREPLVLQLLQVRGALEILVVSLAAVHIQPEAVVEIESILQRQAELVHHPLTLDDLDKLTQLDIDFHMAMCKACQNDLLSEIVSSLLLSFKDDNRTIYTIEKRISLVEEHRSILAAVASHDPEQAENCMKKHINRVFQEVQNFEQNYQK